MAIPDAVPGASISASNWGDLVKDFINNIKAAYVATAQTTTSTTYADLATVGPAVTVVTGTTALVFLSALTNNSVNSNSNFIGVAVSGATTIAAADTKAIWDFDPAAANSNTASGMVLITGLTAGTNTFTAKYRTNSGTATFTDRTIAVIPLET